MRDLTSGEKRESVRDAGPAMGQAQNDAELEREIFKATMAMRDVKRTPAERRAAFQRLRELHAQRSPQQVARMEREQGLRR